MAIFNTNKHYEELPELVYSSYQTNFFDAVENSTDNLILEAVAGSGKTSTIVRACSFFPHQGKHIFLAFNKKIADELSSKVPPHVNARTMHSLCLMILRNNYKKVQVSAKRLGNLAYEMCGAKNNTRMRNWYYDNIGDIKRVIGRFKAMALQDITTQDVEDMIYALDLEIPNMPDTWSFIIKLFNKSIVFDGYDDHQIDFDDMIYHVVTRAEQLDFPLYQTVVIDEAQDFNSAQRQLVHQILDPRGRLIAVGDSSQAIYGFRGADHRSMLHIEEEFNCTKLPLSISYRCSLAVVKQAQGIVPHIEPRDNAPEGRVSSVDLSDYRFLVESGDYILCRCWAPLMREAMRLARNGHNVCMLGNDIAPSLLKWVKNIDKQYDSLQKSTILDYYNLEVAGLPERQEWKKYAMREKADMLCYIVENTIMTGEEVKAVIKEIFTDQPPATPHVLLSTIHRVKGGEADRVFIIRPDLLPHPLARGHEEKIQESNLHYVAITRAKDQLWYVLEDAQ